MVNASKDRGGALARLVADLKRRKVFRVAAAYVVASWVAIQVIDTVGADLGLPAASTMFVFYVALFAFPLVVALSWAYDISPGSEETTWDRRRLGIVLVATLPLLGASALLLLRTLGGTSTAEARELIAQASELVEEHRYAEAHDLLVRAREVIPDDSTITLLWPDVTRQLTVTTAPPGATVEALRFSALGSGEERVWTTLGTTPIRDLVVPREDHLLRLTLEGYRPAERLFAPSRDLAFRRPANEHPDSGVAVRLVRTTGGPPAGMVRVPAGNYELVSPDMPNGFLATLDEFYIERFEVTNEDYLEFVRADGYADATHWKEFANTGDHAETITRFVDQTGQPGPRGWTDQIYPEGKDDYPVTGITWYEAAAYAAFRGRDLPTLHQWEKAARDGAFNVFDDIVLPWGMVRSGGVSSNRVRSLTSRPGPVDEHPFGQSIYGAYAMAGNVKEWLANRHGEGRAVAGGSWQDPLYLFSAVGGHDPLYSASTLGFRTVWLDPDRRRLSRDQGLMTLDTLGITPAYDPVDRSTFRTLLTHYRYDRRPANAEIVATVETEDWVREEIAFDGPEDERVLSYLYLPRRSPPPHQPVLFVPGGAVFFGVEVPVATEAIATPLVHSGGAVFVVVMKGMTGREFGDDWESPELQSVAFRDLAVLHATEMRMGLDYLESRTDLAMEDLAYFGWSRGAASRLMFAAVDDRFQGVVFGGGGIDERFRPVLPEADPVNFAPYIDVPTLLINGRQDEEHPWLTRALPLWNLLSEPRELILLEGAGHRPPEEVLIPAIEAFLDSISVRTQPPNSE